MQKGFSTTKPVKEQVTSLLQADGMIHLMMININEPNLEDSAPVELRALVFSGDKG